ncbi:MAG: Gfo/Idh/MocA family oxidoreductase [Oenococcus sp.]|uniref:Gfo/Idh/MocA family protein n=1 Tax=Oenococcus sp. TaxID=1979414 RepID=UPI0039EA7ED2
MIKFGIIGAGHIANRFAQSLANFPDAELYAISARSMDKARAFQQQHPSELIYDHYQALLDNPQVQIVYVSLPHGLHREWVLKALDAGKAVLCEKPAGLNAQQTQDIIDKAQEKQLFFMEAMKNRFTPAYRKIKELVQNSAIGQLTHIEATFARVLPESQATYHYQPIQGGALLDMGIYDIGLIEDFFKGPLTIGQVDYKMHENGIEVYAQAQLLGDRFSAQVTAAFDRDAPTTAVLTGSKGMITIENFHRPESFTLNTAGKSQSFHLPYDHDDFHGEIQEVIAAFKSQAKESAIMSQADSIACAALIDAIKNTIPEIINKNL